MLKNIIVIITHLALATTLTIIVLFSKKVSTLLFMLIGIFGLICLYLKCGDCPAFKLESSGNKKSSSNFIGTFLLGDNYSKINSHVFTMIILYISFLLAVLKTLGIVLIKFLNRYR